MNSLYQELNKQNSLPQFQPNSNLAQLIQRFKASSNPRQFLNTIIKNNPQMQNVYSMLQNSNKSPKQLFYLLAQQRGIDPNSILSMLK